MQKLSVKQNRILDYIAGFIEENGYPPAIRDIVKGCGISSTSVVDYNMKILHRMGYIRRHAEVSRGIELVDPKKKAGHFALPFLFLHNPFPHWQTFARPSSPQPSIMGV